MARMQLGILISGRGSNMKALIDACAKADYPADIALVLSNVASAEGLETARHAGIKTMIIDHKAYPSRAEFERDLDQALRDHGVELVCLAGFMRLLDKDFVKRWHDRMINIHPSLLPSYRGLKTHERVLEDGVRFTGCTVHYVRPQMDEGPIIMQAVVPIDDHDTPQKLARRVLAYEHKIYVESVRLIASGHIRPRGNKTATKGLKFPKKGLISPTPDDA